jgi:hypothetical protein
MLVGGCAAAILLIVALLIWHANSGRREILAVGPPPANPPVIKNKLEPQPDLAQPVVMAEPKPGSDRAPVVYPPATIAKAKALGDGLTDSDAGVRAKPGGLPAAGDNAPRAPQVADERPAPRVAPDFGADALLQNPFLRDKDLGGLLQRPGGPDNPLDQLLKMAEERNQEIEKLLGAGGGQGAELLDAVKAIQAFGKLQRLPGFPALPGARRPAPLADDPDGAPGARAPDVDELTLSGDGIGDKHLVPLRGLATLRVLTISRTAVTDAGLEHLKGLKGLRQLYLSGTPVTDKGLEHLHGLTELRVLDVTNTRVTDAGIKRLQQALPAVKIMH